MKVVSTILSALTRPAGVDGRAGTIDAKSLSRSSINHLRLTNAPRRDWLHLPKADAVGEAAASSLCDDDLGGIGVVNNTIAPSSELSNEQAIAHAEQLLRGGDPCACAPAGATALLIHRLTSL